jgi:hypothetical protein
VDKKERVLAPVMLDAVWAERRALALSPFGGQTGAILRPMATHAVQVQDDHIRRLVRGAAEGLVELIEPP